MLIAHISDTHIALDTPDSETRISDFERTIAHINALDPQPDVIFHTGDLVQNGRLDEYTHAVEILAEARAPVYVIPGNKDDRVNLRSAFVGASYLDRKSPFITYAIDDFPVRLIALDTLDPGNNKGDFCADRASELTALLSTNHTKPTAVFAHHPPCKINVGPEPWNFVTDEAMQRLSEPLQQSENVIAVFCGHVHRPDFGEIDGTPVTVIPSIATSLRWGEYPEAIKNCPIYFLHSYDPATGFSTASQVVDHQ